MANARFCLCSPCQEQNEVPMDIMPEVNGMQDVEDLIEYIGELINRLETGGQEQVRRPNSVASSINYGGYLIGNLSKRLKWHLFKKCLLSALDRQTRNVLIDLLNRAQHVQFVGMGLSIIAHLLERAEQTSSNEEERLQLLHYMFSLAKHMKNLNSHIQRQKLDEILRFIVKSTVICALQMEPHILCRFIFAPLDAADIENLKSQLVFVYPDLELQALTEALNRLPKFPDPSQGVPDNTVGIQEEQNKVIELLDLQDLSRRVVVIYGIGGIGKTTLATAVFSRLDLTGYDYCRVDMDQDLKHSDLRRMQATILRDVFKENLKLNDCTQGREKLLEAFRKASKSVFLFIDNALRKTDLEMLLPIEELSRLPVQSRILVTTRNLNETNIFELQDGIEVYSHRVDPVSESEAKRLLCHYALGDGNGTFDPGFNMDGLLQICGRVPLVLRIIGSHLRTRGNTVSTCNEILDYYKEWQLKGFEGGEDNLSERMVDFVYKRLKEPSKEAFLDVVFFFHDWKRSKVSDIVGEMQLQDLEGAALVTTSEEDRVNIHDIVRARGRKLSEGTRITDRESWSILLRDEEKLQQTKGIWLDDDDNDDERLSLEAKDIDLMSRSLRVLSVGEHNRLNGLCEKTYKDLRVLRIWYEDMLPIHLSKSRQLVCFHGHLIKGHRFPEILQLPESLRLLYLDGDELDSPVSFDINGDLVSLRQLKLSNITLANFANSISHLKSLRSLKLRQCGGFTSIPESLGNFSCLKILELYECPILKDLPCSYGNLFSLQRLNISKCFMLERLPESLGNLSSLQGLFIRGCSKLDRLPESFGNLSALQLLDIGNCSMLERLPESFGNLSALQRLDINNCSMLERLPESFGNCLQSLKMDGLKNMCSFFDNFGQLKCLKFLSISNCKELKKLPDDIICSSSLAAVKAYGCAELEAKAMDSLVEIKSLMFLEMGESPMLIKRWQQIQQHRPLIGAALRFEQYGEYPYEEIMSTMFFSGGSRFLHVDGEGQLAEVASSSFLDVGVKVGLMMTASDLSNELRQKVVEVASQEFQIIYVDVDVEREAEGSSWMEEREKRIKKTLLELPEGSRGWVCPLHKTSLLFAYSLWLFTHHSTPCSSVDSLIVGTRVLVDKEGRRKLSHSQPLEMIFQTKFRDRRVDWTTLFSPLSEARRLMLFDVM